MRTGLFYVMTLRVNAKKKDLIAFHCSIVDNVVLSTDLLYSALSEIASFVEAIS